MPTQRLSMRRIRQLLALHFGAGASTRVIGRELGIAPSTVREYLARAAAAGIGWPLAADLTDESLVARLFVNAGVRAGARFHAEPDWSALVRELKRPGVNLMVLWEEYRAVHPDGYAYSRFCELFREFERRLSPTMRQKHVAGHKAFVDYSGKRVPITEPLTGEVRMAEIFVAVLGASSLTYAEATWTQTLPDWIGAHVRMFRFYGAAPRLLVPDNLKSGVNKASFYDPEVNRSYAAMAAHYNVGILPARPRTPARQGCRRGRGTIRAILHPRPAAQRHVLLPGRVQCRHRRRLGADERARDAPPWRQPSPTVRDRRAARHAGAPARRSTSMPSGISPASASTTTSRSRASSTRCLIP